MSLIKIRAALEGALDAMAGIIPAVDITSSTAGTVTTFLTDGPHLLSTGLSVKITSHSGSTPDLNDSYFVVVTGASTFTLQHRVTKAAIASTANGTGGVIKANLTAWEGVAFIPLINVPYQRVHLLPATPENPTFGGDFHREIGYMQVTLCYPQQKGSTAAMTRAELIRSTFARGVSFSNSGVIVNIIKTPRVVIGVPEDMLYIIIVQIPYKADIFS